MSLIAMPAFLARRRGDPTPEPATVEPEATPAAWPEDVIARYGTALGSTVDIRGAYPHYWSCEACPASSVGVYTNPWGIPFRLKELHEQAQAHAEKCLALPKPGDR